MIAGLRQRVEGTVVFGRTDFLSSPKGVLAQHRRRWLQRVHIHIDGVEPRKKESMPDEDKDEIQEQVLRFLEKFGRRPFRGPVALKIRLQTTEKNPTHSHHVTKNLLDLFQKPRESVATGRRRLLYADDKHVQALSVICRHGAKAPAIRVFACPFESLLVDLDLAAKWTRDNADLRSEEKREGHLGRAWEEFCELQRDEQRFRRVIGDGYQGFLRLAQQAAQEELLGHGTIRPHDLVAMYDVAGREFGLDFAAPFERIFASSPLRIRLSGPPQKKGSSDPWRKEIDVKLREFQQRYSALIEPWFVPVALEVVIKPPAGERNILDLDNAVRSYLIPKVSEILKPVSDLSFTFDRESLRHTDPKLFEKFKTLRTPPASTKFGVSRYEVWRLRPTKQERDAFVSLAVVADNSGVDDTLGEVEELIGRWRAALEKSG